MLLVLGAPVAVKLCFLISSYSPRLGGMEIYVEKLARGLAKRGHHITIVTTDERLRQGHSYEDIEGVRVIRYPARPRAFGVVLQPLVAIRALFLDFDVIHIHGISPSVVFPLPILRLMKRRPLVLTSYFDPLLPGVANWRSLGGMVTKLFILVIRPFTSIPHELAALSREHTAASPVMKWNWPRVHIIAPGVDSKAFSPNPHPGHSHGPEVLFVGRLAPYKGIEYLIRAMRDVVDAIPKASLKIVGEGPDMLRLMALTKSLRLEGKVIFKGPARHSEVPEIMRGAYLLVLPSVYSLESFGIVILEAFACGKPVVASAIHGPAELVDGAGIVVPPRDVKGLAHAIIRLLSNPDLSRTLGEKGRRLAVHYTWEKVTELHEGLYGRLLSH